MSVSCCACACASSVRSRVLASARYACCALRVWIVRHRVVRARPCRCARTCVLYARVARCSLPQCGSCVCSAPLRTRARRFVRYRGWVGWCCVAYTFSLGAFVVSCACAVCVWCCQRVVCACVRSCCACIGVGVVGSSRLFGAMRVLFLAQRCIGVSVARVVCCALLSLCSVRGVRGG